MSLSLTITKVTDNLWQFEWSGTAPYSLYLNSPELFEKEQTDDTSIQIFGTDTEEPPPLEVADANTTEVQNTLNPARAVLQWYQQGQADRYVVQFSTDAGATWTTYRGFLANETKIYETLLTDELTDGDTAYWRVLAIDDGNNQSQAAQFVWEVVRNPAPPSVKGEYNESTGDLVISKRE